MLCSQLLISSHHFILSSNSLALCHGKNNFYAIHFSSTCPFCKITVCSCVNIEKQINHVHFEFETERITRIMPLSSTSDE